jgi:hypothetical protein
MNNEPVAWMHHCLKSGIGYLSYTKPAPLDDYKPIPLYTHPVKELDEQYEKGFKAGKEEGWKAHKFHHPVKEQLTDEEIDLVREVLNGCVSSIKAEIDQELQTFKGYEHCSNLPSLESELKDAEKAIEILRKAQNG